MIHVINRTPFLVHLQEGARAPAHFSVLNPEPWSWAMQVVVKATFDVDSRGAVPAPNQIPIVDRSRDTELGYMEGDLSFEKDGVDLVVLADAHSPRAAPVRDMEVGLHVGETSWSFVVTGDRVWKKEGGTFRPTDPIVFTTLGLGYARAFGGTYALKSGVEIPFTRNPIGKGWTPNMEGVVFEGRPLPNLESTSRRVTSPEEEIDPVGLAWYRMGWALRMIPSVKLRDGRPPEVLPRLWNAAHPDLILPEYPSEKPVRLDGMTVSGRFEFAVPRLPIVLEHALGGQAESLPAAPDTLCIMPSRGQVFVLARWLVPIAPAGDATDRFITIAPEASRVALQESLS